MFYFGFPFQKIISVLCHFSKWVVKIIGINTGAEILKPGQRSEKTQLCWTPFSQGSSHFRQDGGIRRKKDQRQKYTDACPCRGLSLLPRSAEALGLVQGILSIASCSQRNSEAAGSRLPARSFRPKEVTCLPPSFQCRPPPQSSLRSPAYLPVHSHCLGSSGNC